MTSHPGQETIIAHIIVNISRFNKWNNLLENLYTNCDKKTSTRPFFEKLKFNVLN